MVKQIGKLKKYTGSLAEHPVQTNWERSDQMAYWINAYNAFTIQMILENWPVKSIRDLHQGKPWDVKWIRLGNENYSLNQIENDILRPHFRDPRIHFALNCAARSCAPLSNKAFTGDNLEIMLNSLTENFINDQDYNQIGTKKLALSRIFDWYREDFGNLIEFINRYSDLTVSTKAEIIFNDYDWGLNQ